MLSTRDSLPGARRAGRPSGPLVALLPVKLVEELLRPAHGLAQLGAPVRPGDGTGIKGGKDAGCVLAAGFLQFWRGDADDAGHLGHGTGGSPEGDPEARGGLLVAVLDLGPEGD